VCFEDTLVAEIATRSRVSHSVRLAKRVRFAVLKCRQGAEEAGDVTVRVEGLAFPMLPELQRVRQRLIESVGAEYTPESALTWWVANKDKEFPLGSYKFHRLWNSLWEKRGMQIMPTHQKAKAFWGYLHTVDIEVEGFAVRPERSLSISGSLPSRISARVRYAPESMATGKRSEECGGEVLKKERDRAVGERFARSALSYCALIYGLEVGVPGAQITAIHKLLSPAQWWGPGKEGWQQCDNTWNCTDTATKEQGRLLWRLGAGGSGTSTPKVAAQSLLASKASSSTCFSTGMLLKACVLLLLLVQASFYLTESFLSETS
jgi:hypothetical protein